MSINDELSTLMTIKWKRGDSEADPDQVKLSISRGQA